MSNSLFSTGLSGLNSAQSGLVTTAHNTANVNTPGYSRQAVQVTTNLASDSGAGFVGTGVRVTGVSRSFDQFLNNQLNQAQSLGASLTSYANQIGRIDNLLANQTAGLAPQIQNLFTNVQAVANTPADPASRQQLISGAQAATNQFRATHQFLNDIEADVNSQVAGSVQQINTFAQQIASLNQQVSKFSGGGQTPNDLLDQRDRLVGDLGKLVATKLVVQDGGQYNIFIGSGQSLVLGTNASQLATLASASNPSRTAVGVVTVGGSVNELQDSTLAGGSLGGLLQFRNEVLSSTQNALGRIGIALSDNFNAQQKLGIDLNGDLGKAFFTQSTPTVIANSRNTGDLSLTASFSDTNKLTISDYRLDVGVATPAGPTYTLTQLTDNKAVTITAGTSAAGKPTLTFDGVTLEVPSGTGNSGDTFLIQPTRTGARDLAVLISDPAKIAAAAPLVSGNSVGNQGSGLISAVKVDAKFIPAEPNFAKVTLSFDSTGSKLTGFPAGAAVTVTPTDGSAATTYAAGTAVDYKAGANISFDGINLTITGAPANGDTFTIAKNTGGVSDGSNALLLGALQNKNTIGGSASSFSGAYGQLVSVVGNKARQVEIANTAQTSLTAQVRASQQSVSGVNQDEETANLLMFQQMYQANAKVIQTAATIFDAILAIR
jgi:flagellar hook-associated protein 1 FlgK